MYNSLSIYKVIQNNYIQIDINITPWKKKKKVTIDPANMQEKSQAAIKRIDMNF